MSSSSNKNILGSGIHLQVPSCGVLMQHGHRRLVWNPQDSPELLDELLARGMRKQRTNQLIFEPRGRLLLLTRTLQMICLTVGS